MRLDVPAGSGLSREGDGPRMALVVAGLLRVYPASPEGRRVAVRYAGRGGVLGTPAAVGGPVRTSVQALVDSTLLLLGVRRSREVAQGDARVAWAVAGEVTRRLDAVLAAFAGTAFGSVRQRLARHLLDLAAQHRHGAARLAPVSQQELADATGTVREVVARVLRELRQAGLVDTPKQGVLLCDPAGLHRQAELPSA